MPETFYLETDLGSQECRIITSLYSESYQKHYLIYEYIDGPLDEIFVSAYNPDDEEDDNLMDVQDEKEMQEVEKLFSEFLQKVSDEEA